MNKQKRTRKHTFTLVELLVVLLILGVLVGLAVPRYMDAQKNARFRTFTANVREIQSTLEVYRMDKTSTGPAEYPDNLSELTSYFTQPPINPYTGESMLSDNPKESGLRYENHDNDYTLCVTQLDIDDVNNNGNRNESIPVASHIAKNDVGETCSEPTNSCATKVVRNYEAIVFTVPNDEDLDPMLDVVRNAFGYDNVTVVDVSFLLGGAGPLNPVNYEACHTAERVIAPNVTAINIPLVVILDEDGSVIADFVWPVNGDSYVMDPEIIHTMASLGYINHGIYYSLPHSGDDFDPCSFMFLTEEQKNQIKTALESIYLPPEKPVCDQYKALLFFYSDSDLTDVAKDTFGTNNVVIADTRDTANRIIANSLSEILWPGQYEQTRFKPLLILFDSNNSLIAVLDWPTEGQRAVIDWNKLCEVASLGQENDGIYYSYEYGDVFEPTSFMLLTEEQKAQLNTILDGNLPDTEPPVILAATLTGTVDGEYGEHDITPIGEVLRTVTVSVNDITGMILSITATDNAGIWYVYAWEPNGYWVYPQLDVTSETWKYTFGNVPVGNYQLRIGAVDITGNSSRFSFYLVVTE